jgi:hypothetical protein
MGAFTLSTSRYVRNPVRVQQWNASMRCGDDFNLALTVYEDDEGTLANLAAATARLPLFRDAASPFDHGWGFGYGCDYGWGWFTLRWQPEVVVAGVLVLATPGLVTFNIPAASTVCFFGRYRLALQVENTDGFYSQVEGVLQVRAGLGAGLAVPVPPVMPP